MTIMNKIVKSTNVLPEKHNTVFSNALEQPQQVLNLFDNIQLINGERVVANLIEPEYPPKYTLRNNQICFYRVNQLSYDEDYPHREAFENVLQSLDNEAFNFVYVLTGTKNGIELCIGVVENNNENESLLGKKLSAVNYGDIVANVFEGNFNGSKLEKLKGKELNDIAMVTAEKYKEAGMIVGIPSVNEKESNDEYDYQGIDRLINSMLGREWRVVIVCEPVNKRQILSLQKNIYELYNRFSVYAKRNLQKTDNDGITVSVSDNTSDSRSKNHGISTSDSDSHGWSKGETNTRNGNQTHTKSWNDGTSESHTDGESHGISLNRGASTAVTIEIANKHVQELMKYIDDELLPRMKLGYSKGLFKTSIYYMAEEPTHANLLKVAIMSIFQGNKSSNSPLIAQKLNLDEYGRYNILSTYQSQYAQHSDYQQNAVMLLGRPYESYGIGMNTYLTTKEVSLLAGLPQKEVPGLSLKEAVEFGLNEKNLEEETQLINLGKMVQKGRILSIPFMLSRKSLKKHTFIAGVTGSGKTTTCHRLLSEAKVPFLVIEPAKTEYRTLIKSKDYDDVIVFTLGNETVAPFRINPFELLPGEILSAHVDMVKATFTSAFPMEASMPQILEEAIYSCYSKKGWNINTNTNDIYGEKAFDPSVDSFPIMTELLDEMRKIVQTKGFSAEMQADYEGSLVSRLSNLTVGSKGAMLNCQHSIDFRYIAHHNVILELEELKSPEDKALLMGFVLSRLAAVIKEEHRRDNTFSHITLIEEAHRLLSKVEFGDSGSKKTAVETFTDLLAEVRKYGEGLIVVDQIPNKLASEVLKNTNTKIIHKILAKDDKEAVGDTMLMDDKQKEYLSALETGHTVIFTENTDQPVHVYVEKVSETDEEMIPDSTVRESFNNHRDLFGSVYEFLEIMPYYDLFDKVRNQIRKLEIEDNNLAQLNRTVLNIANNTGLTTAEVWKLFIKRRECIAGIGLKPKKEQENRAKALLQFFTQTLQNSQNFSTPEETMDYLANFAKQYLQ